MDLMGDLFSAEGISLLLVTLITVYVIFVLLFRNAKSLPPGPIGLPILGNLLLFRKNAHLNLLDLRKKYGPVYSLRLGSNKMVVLCDFPSIRSALLQDAFTGFPTSVTSENAKTMDPIKIVSEWVEQRRYYIHLLKDLGFGRSKMEEHVMQEICYVMDIIDEQIGQPMVMAPILNSSVSNNIASLLFGRRMTYDDPKRIMLDQLLKDHNTLFGQVAITAFFPWILPIMRWLHIGSVHKLDDINEKLKQFFNNEIEEHERTLDPGNIRDFIDGYLVEMEKRKGEPHTKFTKPVLQEVAQTFFGAGTDTVKFTLEWLLLTMAAFPDVQDRVQEEIDEMIGTERFPLYKDHSKMPYTQAVIMEVMRWRNVFPLNYFRYTIKDVELNSLFIPKHTNILVHTWSVSHDATLWGHPGSFRPERFLSKDGKIQRKPDHYIPFSMGKRACPGESFASIEVFLYFTAFLQKFNVKPPNGKAVDLEGVLAMSLQPKPQKILFTRRQ